MKKIAILIAIAGTSVMMTECSPKKKIASNELSPEAKVAEVKRNYTPAQMEEGKTIWSASCGKCHKLHDGPDHDVAKWEKVLPRMINRAKLNEVDGGKVRAYLLANAKM